MLGALGKQNSHELVTSQMGRFSNGVINSIGISVAGFMIHGLTQREKAIISWQANISWFVVCSFYMYLGVAETPRMLRQSH